MNTFVRPLLFTKSFSESIIFLLVLIITLGSKDWIFGLRKRVKGGTVRGDWTKTNRDD